MGRDGVEPSTTGLIFRCSTAELPPLRYLTPRLPPSRGSRSRTSRPTSDSPPTSPAMASPTCISGSKPLTPIHSTPGLNKRRLEVRVRHWMTLRIVTFFVRHRTLNRTPITPSTRVCSTGSFRYSSPQARGLPQRRHLRLEIFDVWQADVVCDPI